MKAFLLVLLGVVIALVLQNFVIRHDKQAATKTETAYQRVLKSSVMRCGYGLWEPGVMRDPNTGKVSGLVYEIAQELGKAINVKMDYTLEVPWDSIGVSLSSGKIDAHAAGIWATPARGRVLAFSHPLFFLPTVVFARADDHRFDNNLERINQPDVTVALSDDDITTEIYQHDFPRARKYELPQFAPPEELLLAIATKKADVAVNNPYRLVTFDRTNPGKVRVVPTDKPLRVYPDTIAVDIHEEALLHMLNTAIDQAVANGTVDRLLAKYRDKYHMDYFIPASKPYSLPTKKDRARTGMSS